MYNLYILRLIICFEIDKKFEYPRQDLHLGQSLGEGMFGRVVAAEASNIGGETGETVRGSTGDTVLYCSGYTRVAVKMLKAGACGSDLSDLVMEYNLLKELDHPNVIKLLGACTDSRGPLYLIMEFAEHGSLRTYLRQASIIMKMLK